MALRLLSTRIARPYMPVVRKSATWAVYRGYASKCYVWRVFFFFLFFFFIDPLSVAKKYTLDHEWISIDNGVGTFGITDYAQKSLGDVVFVETPAVGDVVEKQGKIENIWV